MKDYPKGTMIKMIDPAEHRRVPEYYPPYGTIGVVIKADCNDYLVQWADGSTSENDKWYVKKECVTKYFERFPPLIKKGDIVKFNNSTRHREYPEFYPKKGTIGIAVTEGSEIVTVQWENGSTSKNDCWAVETREISLVNIKRRGF